MTLLRFMSHIDGSDGVTRVLTQSRNSGSPSASLECLLELGSLCRMAGASGL